MTQLADLLADLPHIKTRDDQTDVTATAYLPMEAACAVLDRRTLLHLVRSLQQQLHEKKERM